MNREKAEEELRAARARSSDLEVRLTEACTQLEESVACLEEKGFIRRHHTATALTEELEAFQKTIRKRAEELDSLGTDRDGLIQDLKDQATAVDALRLQLDRISEELEWMRTAHGTVEKTLEEERARNLKLQGELEEGNQEVGHLRWEKQTYAGLAEQLSTQIVEMEEEICTLQDHLRDISSQLDQTSNLVLDLRTQLNAKTAEADWLRASSSELLREVQQLSEQLEVKGGDVDRTSQQLRHLQEALLDSKQCLQLAEESFEQEKQRMTHQLLQMEGLVLDLEQVMDPAAPPRFVEHETTGA